MFDGNPAVAEFGSPKLQAIGSDGWIGADLWSGGGGNIWPADERAIC
jgi:hypothetical protein